LEEGRGGGLARDCLDEIRERFRDKRILTGWEREREKFFEERGIKREEVEEKSRGKENCKISNLEERDKEKQRKERWEKIKDSKYNKWYKVIKKQGIPGFLKKGWGENRWRRITRFRLGNGAKEGRY